MAFRPPSLPPNPYESFIYHSSLAPLTEPVILGVDEAGRGPVLGPMVYAVAYCPVSYREDLKSHGYNDSKVLKEDVRLSLFQTLCETELKQQLGWATAAMSPLAISDGMLNPSVPYNLNDQAHDTTRDLIRLVLDSGVNVVEVYVDTVGPPEKYERKLKSLFPEIPQITVAKKADSLYPIVSLASICAKVTRDLCISDELGDACGSGYPSDPSTVRWLKTTMDPLFGWGQYVRYSWQTADKILNEHGHGVTWGSGEESEARKRKTEAKGLPEVSLDILAPVHH